MPDIRPVSDLRNNFKEIEATIRKTNQPIFLTNNGRASMVLLSNEAYDRLVENAPLPAPPEREDADNVVSFGRLLKDFIKARELTAETLAELSGISMEAMNDLLDDQRKPTDDEIESLATALRISQITLSTFLEPATGKFELGVQKALLKILGKIAES